MAFDLAPHLAPARCGVIVFECQEGVIGERSALPGLARAVREKQLLDHLARLLEGSRQAGARIFYCTVAKRPDGVGNPFNTPLEMRLRDRGDGTAAFDAGPVVPELAAQAGDVTVGREHGLTGFYASGLDAYLRNTGVRTVIATGVSVNLGILGTCIEAVNRGYTVVVPPDCVAGDPPEYAEQALRYSLRNIAFLLPSPQILETWKRD